MMRVLALDEALPWPLDSGKRIRTWALLSRLARDFEIVLAYPEAEPPSREAVAAFGDAGIALRAVPRRALGKRGVRFAWDLLRNVVLPMPYMVMAHAPRGVRREVAAILGRERFDLVHVEWTPLVRNVPADARLPVVVAAHNVETAIWERTLEAERRPLRRAYVALQVVKVRRFERRALARADRVIAVSPDDAERIRAETGQTRITVVPNGVDPRTFAPRDDVRPVPGSAVFVGSLDWRPNQDGLIWFLDEVWPRVLARRADATFVAVGRAPPAWLARRLGSAPRTRLVADAPDVRPYVLGAATSVVPLRIGGGSRLKILEALAMERPVVSTTVGGEGLDLGEGVAVADGPEGLADAIENVFERPDEARRAARRGRETVLRHHAWDVLAPLQAEAWRAAAGAGHRAPGEGTA